jgi:RND family efflux transporter MFP subunit
MRISIVRSGLMIVLGLGALTGCRSAKDAETAKPATVTATPVKVVQVARQKISERLTYTGTFEAWQKINITPETAGKVAKIYVDEGQPVEKGQLLAELETESIRLQIKQAEAAVAAADANFKNMEKNKDRMDRLLREKAISDQQYEQVKLGYDAAKAQLDQVQAALNLARHYLDVSIMKAPWSGVVASKNAQVGDVINPMMGGFSPASGILTLMDFSRIKIVLDVSPRDIARLQKGQAAVVTTASAAGREFAGTVSLVGQTADASSKKFRVEVFIENPGLLLRPGTFGDVVLDINTREDTLVLPQKAIIDYKYVFVAENGTARRQEVRIGLQNADFVEILSGLKAGEAVIIEGNYGLENGARIEVLSGVSK